jgi:hypothetical protein
MLEGQLLPPLPKIAKNLLDHLPGLFDLPQAMQGYGHQPVPIPPVKTAESLGLSPLKPLQQLGVGMVIVKVHRQTISARLKIEKIVHIEQHLHHNRTVSTLQMRITSCQ